MKKLFLLCALVGGTLFSAQSLSAQVQSGAQIEFEKETHDFGNLKYGANGTYTFKFKNTGNQPLIISDAKGSCSCTVPSFSKTPIAPGQSGEITVKYDTKKPGPISKSVTITSNAANEPTKVIRIKGNVGPAPDSVTPVNNVGPSNH